MKASRYDRILLVGFMGAGKSSVGQALAGRLGWRFVDFDDEVEREAGMTVSEIFDRFGEARFRTLEARAAKALLRGSNVVLGSGGGWAAIPGRIAEAPAGTAVVWLQVSAAEAVRRVATQPGRRPLLDGDDPLGPARALLEERTTRYAEAPFGVDTEDSSVEDVTARILEMLELNEIDSAG